MNSGCSVVVLSGGPDSASLCAALEAKGIKAVVVGTLDKVPVLVQEGSVRLIVADEALFDSPSVGWELRQQRMIPIALYGGSANGAGWKKAFEMEADAYLSKSITLAEQVARVKALLRGYQTI